MVYHTLRLIMNLFKAMTLSNFSESLTVTTFQVHSNFPTSARTFQLQRNFPTSAKLSNLKKTFQLRSNLSNFGRFFPTSIGSSQLRSVLSNFARFFPTSAQLSNFSFFPTVVSNYTHLFSGCIGKD